MEPSARSQNNDGSLCLLALQDIEVIKGILPVWIAALLSVVRDDVRRSYAKVPRRGLGGASLNHPDGKFIGTPGNE